MDREVRATDHGAPETPYSSSPSGDSGNNILSATTQASNSGVAPQGFLIICHQRHSPPLTPTSPDRGAASPAHDAPPRIMPGEGSNQMKRGASSEGRKGRFGG